MRASKDTFRKNWQQRAMVIKSIVDANYIPESERNCLRAIYNRHIKHVYCISEHTFRRMMQFAMQKDGFVGNGGNRVTTIDGRIMPRDIANTQFMMVGETIVI